MVDMIATFSMHKNTIYSCILALIFYFLRMLPFPAGMRLSIHVEKVSRLYPAPSAN